MDEGATYSLTVGAITDPGQDTVSSYTINWGDGSSDTISAADLASAGGVMSHAYADGDAAPTISVDLVDEDGTHVGAGSKSITVNNVAPDLSLGGASSINTGQLYTLTLGSVVDPGDDTVAQYVINWGDGSSDTIAAGDLPAGREVTHTYASAADVTISVDLVDEDGTESINGGHLTVSMETLPTRSTESVATGVDVDSQRDLDQHRHNLREQCQSESERQ